MVLRFRKYLIALLLPVYASAVPQLFFYCGTTMVKPMQKIAALFEQTHNCKINIIQGGSQDLYNALRLNRRGDLFLSGSDRFLKKEKGLYDYNRTVGYNQLAIFIRKGNPFHISGLEDLTRKTVLTSIGNPETSSIGTAARGVLKRYGGRMFVAKVELNLYSYAADSRDMNRMFAAHHIDMGLNWKATASFPKNRDILEIIEIPERLSPKKTLTLVRLKYTRCPKMAKAFIDFAASKEGMKIMHAYGFSDE